MQAPNLFLIWEEALAYAYTNSAVEDRRGDLEQLAQQPQKAPNKLYDPPSLAYYLY